MGVRGQLRSSHPPKRDGQIRPRACLGFQSGPALLKPTNRNPTLDIRTCPPAHFHLHSRIFIFKHFVLRLAVLFPSSLRELSCFVSKLAPLFHPSYSQGCRSASPQNLARDPSMGVVPALLRPLCLPRDHYRHHSRLSHRRSKGHRRRPSRQRDQDCCRPCSSNQPPRRREARTDCRRRWQERVHPQQECKGARKVGRCRRCHPCSPQDKCHPYSSQRSSSRRRTRRRRCRRNNRHSPCKRTQPLSSRSSSSSLQRHARRGRFARACRSKSSSTSERGSTSSTAC